MSAEPWLSRFERASWARRLQMLGGGAARVTATVVDRAIHRAADIALEANDAFRKELDPNVSDAKILEETVAPPPRAGSPGAD